ncbi:hypothetical protein DIPPA_07255 [Diplonema papillatum]|nr:hypothetical protein DIPPA_07255 [Diplonema papillatum]
MLPGLPSGAEARRYLVEKKLMAVLEQGLEKLLRERPSDPCGSLAGHLRENNPLRPASTLTVRLTAPAPSKPGAPGPPPPKSVTLQHVKPPVKSAGSFAFDNVAHWRRAGQLNVWGIPLPGKEGWKDVARGLKRGHPEIKRCVVILVDENRPVVYYKNVGYCPCEFVPAGVPLVELLKANGLKVTEASVAVRDAFRQIDSLWDVFVEQLPLANSFVPPDLSVFDEVYGFVKRNLGAANAPSALSPDDGQASAPAVPIHPESVAFVVASSSGKDDVSAAMMLVATVVSQMTTIRTLSVQKRAWIERLRDKEVLRKEAHRCIEEIFKQKVAKDDAKTAAEEHAARTGVADETARARDARLHKADKRRQRRREQWDRYLLHVQSEASTAIAALFRGHSDRKLARKRRDDARGSSRATRGNNSSGSSSSSNNNNNATTNNSSKKKQRSRESSSQGHDAAAAAKATPPLPSKPPGAPRQHQPSQAPPKRGGRHSRAVPALTTPTSHHYTRLAVPPKTHPQYEKLLREVSFAFATSTAVVAAALDCASQLSLGGRLLTTRRHPRERQVGVKRTVRPLYYDTSSSSDDDCDDNPIDPALRSPSAAPDDAAGLSPPGLPRTNPSFRVTSPLAVPAGRGGGKTRPEARPPRDIFEVVAQRRPDDEIEQDFACPVAAFLDVVHSCAGREPGPAAAPSHGRCPVTELFLLVDRYGVVPSVLSRAVRSLAFLALGTQFAAYVVVNEVKSHPDSIGHPYFQAKQHFHDPSAPLSTHLAEPRVSSTLTAPAETPLALVGGAVLPSFERWASASDAFETLRNSHLAMVSRALAASWCGPADQPEGTPRPGGKDARPALPALHDRVVVRVPQIAAAQGERQAGEDGREAGGAKGIRKASNLRKSLQQTWLNGGAMPKASRTSSRVHGSIFDLVSRAHCFSRPHKKLPVFSVPDPAAPADVADVLAHLPPAAGRVLWLSLSPDVHFSVADWMAAAPLRAPLHAAAAATMALLRSCVVSPPESFPRPDSADAPGRRADKKRAKNPSASAPAPPDDEPAAEPAAGGEPDAEWEVPLFGLKWSVLEEHAVKEARQAISKTGEISFYDISTDESGRKIATERTQQVLHVEKPVPDLVDSLEVPEPRQQASVMSLSRSSDQNSVREKTSARGQRGLGKKQLSQFGAPSGLGSHAPQDGDPSKPRASVLASPESPLPPHDDATAPSQASAPTLPTDAATVVVPYSDTIRSISRGRTAATVEVIRQPLLEGATPTFLRTLRALCAVVEDRLVAAGSPAALSIVVGHSDELNGMLLVLFAITFSLLSKKHYNEDQVEMLVKARKQSELNQQKKKQQVGSDSQTESQAGEPNSPGQASLHSDDETLSDDGTQFSSCVESEESTPGLSLTKVLMGSRPSVTDQQDPSFRNTNAFDVGEEQQHEDEPAKALSPFPCVHDLAVSPLGVAMGVPGAISYLDVFFEHSNKHIEDSVVGAIAETMLALRELQSEAAGGDSGVDPVSSKALHLKLCRQIECYVTLIFHCSWLLAYTRDESPSTLTFDAWLDHEHPEAIQWLANIDPWSGQGPSVQPAWGSMYHRWKKQTLLSQIL